MDTSVLEDWIVELASVQKMRVYYEVNTSVSHGGKIRLYEYPQDGHRICILHPAWLDLVYDICNRYGIALLRIGEHTQPVSADDKVDILRSMVETKSVLLRRGTMWFLSWNNQRVKADLVYDLSGDRYITTRGAYMYVITKAGQAKALEV